MDESNLRQLIEAVRGGRLSTDEALLALRRMPFENLGFAHPDSHRSLRSGFAEVVLCLGKRTEHIVEILLHLAQGNSPVLATRASPEVFDAVSRALPGAQYNELARTIVFQPQPLPKGPGR